MNQNLKVMQAVDPVDLRKSFHGLYAAARSGIGEAPEDGRMSKTSPLFLSFPPAQICRFADQILILEQEIADEVAGYEGLVSP